MAYIAANEDGSIFIHMGYPMLNERGNSWVDEEQDYLMRYIFIPPQICQSIIGYKPKWGEDPVEIGLIESINTNQALCKSINKFDSNLFICLDEIIKLYDPVLKDNNSDYILQIDMKNSNKPLYISSSNYDILNELKAHIIKELKTYWRL